MTARTPPSAISHFSFNRYVPRDKTPDDVHEEVLSLLKEGKISEAEEAFTSAVEDGVFSDALGVSYSTWNDQDSFNKLFKASIEKAITTAKDLKSLKKPAEVGTSLADTSKKA